MDSDKWTHKDFMDASEALSILESSDMTLSDEILKDLVLSKKVTSYGVAALTLMAALSAYTTEADEEQVAALVTLFADVFPKLQKVSKTAGEKMTSCQVTPEQLQAERDSIGYN